MGKQFLRRHAITPCKHLLSQQHQRTRLFRVEPQRVIRNLPGTFELRLGGCGGGQQFSLALQRAVALRVDSDQRIEFGVGPGTSPEAARQLAG